MLWNEPNNLSHWDRYQDPEWALFAEMICLAGERLARVAPGLPRVLGGISPIDPLFIRNLFGRGIGDAVDVVAVHGFPLDWNRWHLSEWPKRIELIRAAWPFGAIVHDNTLDVYIARLRRKLRLLGDAPQIATVHGTGYQFG